jgi:hypothetical protein
MSTVLVILDSNTLSVSDWYFSDSPFVPSTPGITLQVPDGLTWDTVMGQKDSEDNVTLVQDPTKVAAKTAQAWSALRTQRNFLLAQSDWTQFNDSPLSSSTKRLSGPSTVTHSVIFPTRLRTLLT